MHSDAVTTFSLLREYASLRGVGQIMATLMTTGRVLRTGRISNWCDRFRGERVVCHPKWAFAEGEVAAVNRLVSPLLVLSGA